MVFSTHDLWVKLFFFFFWRMSKFNTACVWGRGGETLMCCSLCLRQYKGPFTWFQKGKLVWSPWISELPDARVLSPCKSHTESLARASSWPLVYHLCAEALRYSIEKICFNLMLSLDSLSTSWFSRILRFTLIKFFHIELDSVFLIAHFWALSLFFKPKTVQSFEFFFMVLFCRFQTRSRSRNAWTHSLEVGWCEICASCQTIYDFRGGEQIGVMLNGVFTPLHHGHIFPLVVENLVCLLTAAKWKLQSSMLWVNMVKTVTVLF